MSNQNQNQNLGFNQAKAEGITGMNSFFKNLLQVYCQNEISSPEWETFTKPFFNNDNYVRGVGLSFIEWPDIQYKTLKVNCSCSQDKCVCDVQPLRETIDVDDRKVACFNFSENELIDAFCSEEDVNRLAETGNNALFKSEKKYLNVSAIADWDNLDNYYLDGVQGKQYETENLSDAIYEIALDFVQGTNRFNKHQIDRMTPVDRMYIVINKKNFIKYRKEIISKYQPLFSECGSINECKINWVFADIKNSDAVFMDLKAYRIFRRFQDLRRDDSKYATCDFWTAVLHWQTGHGFNKLENYVSIKLTASAEDKKNAEDIKTTIDGITGADLNVNANTQAVAKTEIQNKIDTLITDKKGLELVYTYSDFKAPTSEVDGSIKVVIDIQKQGSTLATSEQKTFILKYVVKGNKK